MRKKEKERILEVTAQYEDPLDLRNVDHLDFRYHGSSGSSIERNIGKNNNNEQPQSARQNL